MRVFLDTNVLVAAFATRGLCSDVLRLVLTEHELIMTEVVLLELTRVLRDRIRLPDHRVEEIEAFLATFLAKVDFETGQVLVLRDVSDVPIVLSAIAARAELIVSGDKDLTEADLPIRVLRPRDFWELLRALENPASEVHEPR